MHQNDFEVSNEHIINASRDKDINVGTITKSLGVQIEAFIHS